MKKPDSTMYEGAKAIYDEALENEYWKENGFHAEISEVIFSLIKLHRKGIRMQRVAKNFNIAVLVLATTNTILSIILKELDWITWFVLATAFINNHRAYKTIKEGKEAEIDAAKSIELLKELLKLRTDWLKNELGVIL